MKWEREGKWNDNRVRSYIIFISIFPRSFRLLIREPSLTSLSTEFVSAVWLEWPEDLRVAIDTGGIDKTGIIFFFMQIVIMLLLWWSEVRSIRWSFRLWEGSASSTGKGASVLPAPRPGAIFQKYWNDIKCYETILTRRRCIPYTNCIWQAIRLGNEENWTSPHSNSHLTYS